MQSRYDLVSSLSWSSNVYEADLRVYEIGLEELSGVSPSRFRKRA